MSRWQKSPPELIARFGALLPAHPDVEPRKMFGYPCAFVRGNFWVGLHEGNIVVRLPDGAHLRVDALREARPFDPMGGRPMRGWFVVPPAVVGDDVALRALLAAALPLALAQPPKVARGGAKASVKKPAPKKPAGKKPAPKKPAPKKPAPKKPAPKIRAATKPTR